MSVSASYAPLSTPTVLIDKNELVAINQQTLDFFKEDLINIYDLFFQIFSSAAHWDDVVSTITNSVTIEEVALLPAEQIEMESEMDDHHQYLQSCYTEFNEWAGRAVDWIRSLPPGQSIDEIILDEHGSNSYKLKVYVNCVEDLDFYSPRSMRSDFSLDSSRSANDSQPIYNQPNC